MAIHFPLGERRGDDRPSNGDTRHCPECGAATFEFNERYRLAPRSGRTVTVPAWICDVVNCRHVRFARRDDARAARKGR